MTDSELSVPRKRRRPAKSCEQCRRRKIRCDQNMPCGACVRARASLQCSYLPDSVDTRGISAQGLVSEPAPVSVLSPESSTVSVSTGQNMPHQSHDVDAAMQRRQTGDSLTVRQAKTIDDLRRHIQQLEAQLISLRSPNYLPTPSGTTTGPEVRQQEKYKVSTDRSQSSASDICIPVTLPRLRNAPDKTKLFGQSHWLHTAEKFQVVGKFDATEVEPAFAATHAELTSLVKETRGLRRAIIAQDLVQFTSPAPDLSETLPPKAVCDELVRCYFRTFELIYRVVHVPTFWKEYNQFWGKPGSTSTPAPFLTKLVLILAIGATFYPKSSDIDHANLLQKVQTWIYAAQWWLTGLSEKSTATLDGLQVFCLLILARQATHTCPGGPAWLSTGSLMSMAQVMGLHRDSKLFPSLSQFQTEMRARLWTTVLELVCKSSLDFALPPCISVGDFDTTSPSNFDDQDLSPDGTAEQLPRDGITDSSIQLLLAKSLPLRLRVAHLLNDFRGEQSYQAALESGAELRTACRDVASFFHSSLPRAAHDTSALLPTDFHKKFLDAYLRRFILLLHRPFMLRARRDPRFYLARKVCVESATVIGSYSSTIDLDIENGSLDDLSRLSMAGRGVFKGALSLDVILVLALEVVTQLEEEGPHQSVPDPLDKINKASRAPLIRILERISDQLLQIISMGSPSLKRYLMLSAYLSQIRAMESGQNVKQAVYEALAESMKKCRSLLKSQVRLLASSDGGTIDGGIASAASASFYPPHSVSMDTDTPWDISYLLDFPLIGEEGLNTWDM